MVNNLETYLGESLSEALEDMAFMEVAPGEPDQGLDQDAPWVWSQISLVKPLRGRMVLAMPAGLLNRLTSEIFMGMDEAETSERGLDVIRELANIVAGRVMRRAVGEEAGFEVGLPSTGQGRMEDLPGDMERHVFNAEEEPIVLLIHHNGRN